MHFQRNADNRSGILAGTGSRQLQLASLADKRSIFAKTIDAIQSYKDANGLVRIMSGGAEGFDSCLARAAMHLELPLILALPNKSYGSYYFGKNSVTKTNRLDKFREMVDYASEVVYISDFFPGQGVKPDGRHLNFRRNDFMVAEADHMLVYDSKSPGTKDCFTTIKKTGRPFTLIN